MGSSVGMAGAGLKVTKLIASTFVGASEFCFIIYLAHEGESGLERPQSGYSRDSPEPFETGLFTELRRRSEPSGKTKYSHL